MVARFITAAALFICLIVTFVEGVYFVSAKAWKELAAIIMQLFVVLAMFLFYLSFV